MLMWQYHLFCVIALLLQIITANAKDVPRIESFMFRDNIVEGSVVSVTCFALAKTKPISFEWLKNGMKITGMESNIRISTSDEISGLILEPVNLEDSGNYTCSATNINGKDKFTAELTVKASPKWLIQPNDEISTIGGSVTAQCVATGSPVPQIKWLKKIGEKDSDLKPVPHSLETKNSSILKINPISYDDAGLYICVADNGIEPSIKSNFTLVIRGMQFYS